MPKLYEQSTNRLLGEISQADLDLLIAQFEEESSRDRDYYVNNDTFLLLADSGASAALLDALKMALDANGECDVRWEAD
ncbi:MAG: galactosyldiacylglycerol synthase [Gammaproteobacteria bacterium]|nr:galactosyldiacylglycerol synthase [Gammaproteobacteria bacterium]